MIWGYDQIRAEIQSLETQAFLRDEMNFVGRAEAMDRIEFHVLDHMAMMDSVPSELIGLKQRAEFLFDELAKIDQAIFQRLRGEIARGTLIGESLWREVEQYIHPSRVSQHGYDSLDVFVNGLLRLDTIPQETRAREPEMVFYQPTPVHIVLKLIDQANIRPQDIFYDLGSGLGQVCLLVNLLAGAKSRGVEVEPGFCDYARRCANRLNLSNVEFINCDARDMNYADGTIFFMYTPFKGEILRQVLQKLNDASRRHPIRVSTFGACSQAVAQQNWLRCVVRDFSGDHEFAVFEA